MAMQGNVVAVVDDDPEIRKAMHRLLSALGFRTEVFGSAGAFVDAAITSEATCLVVDIQLGDMSGIELGRQLATNGFKFPIIFMTALDDEAIMTQATALGCVAYLRKPFSANLLIAAIVNAVRETATPDE